MTLKYSSQFMYQQNGVEYGISDKTKQQAETQINQALAKVEKNIENKHYGFINILSEKNILSQVKQQFHALRWAKYLVVVGIGGSDLGGRTIQEALEIDQPPLVVHFHGDSTDPRAITKLMQQIELEDSVFCIISKSGETIETISQYVFFKNVLQKQVEDWSQHFIFITDQKKGVLREEADQHEIPTLAIPDDVGGRFSVQTTVGLLPAIAMGVDLEQFSAGMEDVVKNHRTIAQQIASDQFLLAQQGIKINVLMPYSIQLQEFGRWYRQLWAESLGKDGKGILPIKAWGPADQHSQLQFYTQGELMHSLLFLKVDQTDDDYTIEAVDLDAVSYLQGRSFHQILLAEQQATSLALKKLGRPNATLSIEKLNEFSLGQLFMIFELAVVYLAEMLEIDAFDQPGVEESKQMMYALLGRAGFEEKKAEIEKLLGN